MKPKLLTELINVNHNFKTSINLSLNINDHDKLGSFIPTTSSVVLLNEYLDSIIDKNDFSTLLIGPYGKGKSHLVLVLLAIISWRRDLESNRQTIYELCEKIKRLSEQTVALAEKIIYKNGIKNHWIVYGISKIHCLANNLLRIIVKE